MKNCIPMMFAAIIFFLPTLAAASAWEIDPVHSSIQFSVRHLMISNVRGVFRLFKGNFEIDDKEITKSSADAVIIANSIDTGVEKRDRDLRSGNFFAVAQYPTIAFMSKRITRTGPNSFKMTGDLTMHGVTREVVLDMTGLETVIKDQTGKMRRGANLATRINRKDFGLTYNRVLESGGVMIGDDVDINIELEMIRK